ncbi:probable 4-coumarate--CoA ligase 3 [Teleopsis dalmanni]|uniref:probable 4-coumarate--CoA ligase 3 n=1 Tax=Teleopsis dalmanni TaxID=139649 RepID=UPI0018CF1C0A|nr:probable 4-coumarate--CoA ligase 3 [Teleopsis dalmanni]
MEQYLKTTFDPETKIWSGINMSPKFGPDCSIGKVVLDALLKEPDHICQICYHNGKEYTNREIVNLSICIALHFKDLGLQQQDIIGICASNSDYVAPIFIGAMFCGLIVSTLDPSFDKDGIKHIYGITKPKILFCDGGIYETLKEAFQEINLESDIYTIKDHIVGVPNVTNLFKEVTDKTSFEPVTLRDGCHQTAVIVCSSGTTGLPKGVSMSHINTLNASSSIQTPGENINFSYSTLYWASGLFTQINCLVGNITRVIIDKPYNAKEFFDIIQKYKVTYINTPPSQLAMSLASPKLKDYDLSSLKTYFCGGSAVPYKLVKNFMPYVPNAKFFVGYGMTECGSPVACGIPTPNGCIGQLTPRSKVKIIDDDGKQLGPVEIGEICMWSQFPWSGYFNNMEATNSMYINGWLHSGDLGYMDENGYLFVVDRKKDILKYNNFHFYPTEIEQIIMEIPDVVEVCVCGIPDIVSTHLPTAAVVRKPGSDLTETEVYDYVAEKMAHFKHLRGGVYFMNSLPKTASGKYLRRDVLKICEELYKNKQLNR